MKKLLVILLLFTSINMVAQKHERIKTLKIAFITEKLNLTTEEAQKFWPIYNKYEDETNLIKHQEIRKTRNEIRTNFETMSNARADQLISKLNNAETKLYELQMKFNKDLSKIISSKKMILLKIAEDDFKKKMFEEFKKRRGNH